MTDTAGTIDVALNAEPVLVLVYAVKTSPETIELPRTPKVEALLESWLKANAITPAGDGEWTVGARGESMSFDRALGFLANEPA